MRKRGVHHIGDKTWPTVEGTTSLPLGQDHARRHLYVNHAPNLLNLLGKRLPFGPRSKVVHCARLPRRVGTLHLVHRDLGPPPTLAIRHHLLPLRPTAVLRQLGPPGRLVRRNLLGAELVEQVRKGPVAIRHVAGPPHHRARLPQGRVVEWHKVEAHGELQSVRQGERLAPPRRLGSKGHLELLLPRPRPVAVQHARNGVVHDGGEGTPRAEGVGDVAHDGLDVGEVEALAGHDQVHTARRNVWVGLLPGPLVKVKGHAGKALRGEMVTGGVEVGGAGLGEVHGLKGGTAGAANLVDGVEKGQGAHAAAGTEIVDGLERFVLTVVGEPFGEHRVGVLGTMLDVVVPHVRVGQFKGRDVLC